MKEEEGEKKEDNNDEWLFINSSKSMIYERWVVFNLFVDLQIVLGGDRFSG
jgi:hypothetical protein